ncbi:MAG TPA: DNA-binding protein [Clostridiales bacterium]|nr:DNA-binding protein [Clostridiales bacterium]
MDNLVISYNLHRIRKNKHLSQDAIAKIAGISRVAYRSIEAGSSSPRVSTLQNLASALDVKLVDLLTPVKALKNVRYRSFKRMNSRDSILIDVGKWLDDYNYLEEILDQKASYIFTGFQDLLPQDLVGEARSKYAAQMARKVLGLNGNDSIRDIAGLIEDNGIKLYPIKLVSDGFFGLSVSEYDGGPAIVVNVWERISVERWIFSAAHELGHLLLHLDSYDVDQVTEDESQEDEANVFASYFLMPEDPFNSEWQETAGLDLVERVLKLKSIFNVSYRTVLYRISEKLGKDIWPRFNMAYAGKYGHCLKRSEEPMALNPSYFHCGPEMLRANEPEAISHRNFVEDHLSRLVRLAVETEKISLGRGAEILGYDLIKMREIVSSWV